MQNRMDRIESLLFNYGSTNRSDIRPIDHQDLAKVYSKPIIDSSVKDNQTFIDGTSTEHDKGMRNQFEQVVPKRARIVMAPAVNIDNISDPNVREILIKDMYTSSTRRAYDYEPVWRDVRAPLPARYARANPLALSKCITPYVSSEWREESAEWDKKQLRAYYDANKVFWASS